MPGQKTLTSFFKPLNSGGVKRTLTTDDNHQIENPVQKADIQVNSSLN